VTDHLPEFRLAEPEDYVRVCEIFNANIAIGGTTLWERSFTVETIRNLFSDFNPRERAFVMELKGQVIGWGMIKKYTDKEGYSTTCETSVFLDRSYIDKGYGSSFKKFIIAQCKQLGYHHLHAKILATNKISIAYNKKLGYTVVGVQKEVGRVNQVWVDVVIMQLLI
jgi:phosphinothricin acetyltransferase